LNSSLSIIRVIKSRRIRWSGHVARTVDIRKAYNILVGKPEEKKLLEDLDVGGKIILEWTLGK
jgi:hypothetical protein